MSAIIPVVFFVMLLLLLCALVGIARPSLVRLTTRKQAAQSAGVFLAALFILGSFLPDTDSAPEQAQPASAQVSQPDCAALPDRIQRLECDYHHALAAHAENDTRLLIEHLHALSTACPPCRDIAEACEQEWLTRHPGELLLPPAESARCMDQAWPPAVWPRYQPLPLPTIPPELAAHMRLVQQRHQSDH